MLEAPIQIGNIDLMAFTSGHAREHWEAYRSILVKEIIRHPSVFLEYHPKEHTLKKWPYQLLNDQINLLNSTDNYLFIKVTDLCEKLRKDVWVFDPAYNESFILLHGMLFAVSAFPPAALALEMGRELYQHRHDLITRGTFLKGGIAAASAVTATALGIGAFVGPNKIAGPSPAIGNMENNFRESMVAQHLVDQGAKLPRLDALFITTASHWQGTRFYLENETARKQILDRYLWLGNFDIFKHLFRARHYPDGHVPSNY